MMLLNPNVFIWFFVLSCLTIGYFFEKGSFKKEFRFPFLTFTLLIFYHDFIFINIAYFFEVDNIVLSSSWKEIILLLSFCFFLIKDNKISRLNLKLLAASTLFVLLGVLSSIYISKSTFTESILVGKNYIFPFLFLCALSIIPDTDVDIRKSCNVFFYAIIIPNFIFNIYELLYVRDIGDLWFYEALTSAGHDFAYFNHFREGNVRVNGFFVGTLAYAATAFCSCIFFIMLRKERYSYLKIALSFSMLYLSQTRTFFIGLIFFLLLYFASKLYINRKIRTFNILIILFSFFISILLLLPIVTQELSAIGRLEQWKSALELILTNPIGLGFSSIGIGGDNRADSQIIDLIRIYGMSFIILFFGFISFIVLHWNNSRAAPKDRHSELPFLAIISFVFILFFQSLVNTPIMYFLLLLLFKSKLKNRVDYA